MDALPLGMAAEKLSTGRFLRWHLHTASASHLKRLQYLCLYLIRLLVVIVHVAIGRLCCKWRSACASDKAMSLRSCLCQCMVRMLMPVYCTQHSWMLMFSAQRSSCCRVAHSAMHQFCERTSSCRSSTIVASAATARSKRKQWTRLHQSMVLTAGFKTTMAVLHSTRGQQLH